MAISKEDVIQVANDLKISVTNEQVEAVIERYPSEAANDPTGTWDLIVETCLYAICVD